MKKILTIILLGILLLSLSSLVTSNDEELTQVCAGDDELIIHCLGDAELNSLGYEITTTTAGTTTNGNLPSEKGFLERFNYLFYLISALLIFCFIFILAKRRKKEKEKELY